jgi:hypothetical protein
MLTERSQSARIRGKVVRPGGGRGGVQTISHGAQRNTLCVGYMSADFCRAGDSETGSADVQPTYATKERILTGFPVDFLVLHC